jgi:gluconate 2-dehydrogenase gamma chain
VKSSDDTGAAGLTFFFLDEADTVEALAARIVPGSEEDPGAREIGVLRYLDRALSGAYSGWQGAYREGLRTLNSYTEDRYGKKFFKLSEADQDAVVDMLEKDQVPGYGNSADDESGAEAFFTMVWAHTVEGMFSDPAYGGNLGGSGWQLIGFPGAQYGYDEHDMHYGADLSEKEMMTLQDIGKLARERPDLFYHRPGPEPSAPEEETPEVPTPPREPGQSLGQGQ